jgi:hypothetical protein
VTDDDARIRRLAANEAIARQVNEQVEQLGERWNTPDEPLELLCECSRAECTQRLHVSLAEYRAVRDNDARFMLVDDHVDTEIERRVDQVGDATVVEKFGPGRDVAVATA